MTCAGLAFAEVVGFEVEGMAGDGLALFAPEAPPSEPPGAAKPPVEGAETMAVYSERY